MLNLLTDEQIRHFIVDGYLIIEPDIDDQVHESIDNRVRFATENEFPMGNNIAARVPQLWDVLRSPRVHGALLSLLGPNYYVHPHRAIHTSRPIEDRTTSYDATHNAPPMGKGSMAGSGWHQDAQSPLSRPRYHTPKCAIGFYFPHATPEQMGPTRFQAGSYLFSEPVEPTGVILPEKVKAGTFVLLHFDMVHAGWPNRTDITRYMIKFVFVRTEQPKVPTWDHRSVEWCRPGDCLAELDVTPAWNHLWSWLRGDKSIRNGELVELDDLNSLDQAKRLNAIYSCSAERDINALVLRIRGLAGQGLHTRRLAKDREGNYLPRDNVIGKERRWTERALVFDDAAYALGALGEEAINSVLELLEDNDPWVLINALFAIGEVGTTASRIVGGVIRLLDHPLQQVVRQTLDTLGSIGASLDGSLGQIERLLTTSNPEWQKPEVGRGWTGEDQVRLNAVFCLLSGINYDNDLDQIERIFAKSLKDSNGYVPAVAVEGLTRLGTTTSHAAAIQYLQDRRWDDTLLGRVKPF